MIKLVEILGTVKPLKQVKIECNERGIRETLNFKVQLRKKFLWQFMKTYMHWKKNLKIINDIQTKIFFIFNFKDIFNYKNIQTVVMVTKV